MGNAQAAVFLKLGLAMGAFLMMVVMLFIFMAVEINHDINDDES